MGPRRERELTQSEIDLVHRTVARGTTPDQFSLFLWHCRKHHMDPVAREVYCVLFNTKQHHQDYDCLGPPECNFPRTTTGIWHPGKDMVIMTGVGGIRNSAARHHDDSGSVDAPEFVFGNRTTPAGRKIPESVTVKVWKKGSDRPTAATVYWDEFAPVDLTTDKASFWNKMPCNQLAKCGEVQAHKKAYPDLTDIYVPEELARKMSELTPEGREMVVYAPKASPEQTKKDWEAFKQARSEEAKKRLEAMRATQGGGKPVTPNAAATPPQPRPAPQGNTVLGVITVDGKNWTVTGDLANLSPELEKLLLIRWEADQWHVNVKDVVELEKVCRERNYQFQLLTPPSSPVKGPHVPTPSGGKPGGRRPAPDAVSSTVTGQIDRVTREIKGTKQLGQITIVIGKKKPTYGCWDKDITDILAGAIGKQATVDLMSRSGWTNIVGVRKAAGKTYTDGKIPDIQVDREPGKTLF